MEPVVPVLGITLFVNKTTECVTTFCRTSRLTCLHHRCCRRWRAVPPCVSFLRQQQGARGRTERQSSCSSASDRVAATTLRIMHYKHRARRLADPSSPEFKSPDFQKTWETITRPRAGFITVGTPTPDPLPSTSQVIESDLTAFWSTFRPDLDEDSLPEPDTHDNFWDDIRLRTAPWGADDWTLSTQSSIPDIASDVEIPSDDESGPPSLPPSEASIDHVSGPPLPTRFQPGTIHLLDPARHVINEDADVEQAVVDCPPPLRLRGPDRQWYERVLTHGILLTRPLGAPKVFIKTRHSRLMDRIIDAWRRAGLLTPNRQLKYAFPMFAVPKSDGNVRPILDLSMWTDFIVLPDFSLKSAGLAIRDLQPNDLMIKLDLKAGFHHLPLHAHSFNHIGLYYRGVKYSLTRLPMGHALAPALFQRFARAVLTEVELALDVRTIAYLDDWLLAHHDPIKLQMAVNMIRTMGLTINNDKSILVPTTSLQYLGFKVDTREHTIQITLTAHSRMMHLLRYVRRGSDKDRKRIAGYANWLLYNLRFPHFLSRDITLGDPSWLKAAFEDLSVLQPRPLLNAPMTVNLFTDATPHSVAAIIPSLNLCYAQAFLTPEEINRAEAVAALRGLSWAASQLLDTHIVLFVDNASVFSTLRSGTGRLWRHHDLRRMYLSMLHNLRHNTFEVQPILSEDNPADRPSRQVLRTLLNAPYQDLEAAGQDEYYINI